MPRSKIIKNLAVIEARMSSTRLPGKVLKDLNRNFKVIDYVILSVLGSKYFSNSNVVVAIPNNQKQIKLKNYIKKRYKVGIHCGSEKNVFERIKTLVEKKPSTNLLRVTADNPLIDHLLINRFVKYFDRKKNVEYLSTRSMEHSKLWKSKSDFSPGISLEIFKSYLLKKIANKVNNKNMQFPTYNIFSNPDRFKLEKFKIIDKYKTYKANKTRFTLDYKKDLIYLKGLFQSLNLVPGENNFLKICEQKLKKSYNHI